MMIRFRTVWYLQIITLVFAVTEPKANTTVEGNTTISSIEPKANTTTVEGNTTISSIEESTTQEKRGETFNCQESLNTSFMIDIHCRDYEEPEFHFLGLILSDRWVLSQAWQLDRSCEPALFNCRIGNGTDQVGCKATIFPEKLNKTAHQRYYNLGLLLAKDPLRRWSGVLPWPEARGFTDKCTELSIYGNRYPFRKCHTFKAVGLEECIAAEALRRQSSNTEGFLCAKSQHLFNVEERMAYGEGLAVCNNVVVGIPNILMMMTQRYLPLTKIEAYYSFIHEKTNLPVPFESSPNEIEEYKPQHDYEKDRQDERDKSTERNGYKWTERNRDRSTERPTSTSSQRPTKNWREQQWQQRKVSNAPEHSQASCATSFKVSRFLLFLSIVVPLLVKLLCQ